MNLIANKIINIIKNNDNFSALDRSQKRRKNY